MKATAAPVIAICLAIWGSYHLGSMGLTVTTTVMAEPHHARRLAEAVLA